MVMITQENRLEPRVRVQVRMEVEDVGRNRPHVLLTTNLSASGARATGRVLLEVGSRVSLRLYLPLSEGGRDREMEVAVGARVVHAAARLEPNGSIRESEYGFAFDELALEVRDELRSFLLECMADDSSWHGPSGEEPR